MHFNIVEFRDGLHVIPFSWLTDDNKQAYWPPYKDTIRMCKAVANMETPVKDNWELIEVLTLLGSADKYPEATAKLKLMKDASDLENFATEETLKKSRAKRHRVLAPISPETSEGEEIVMPELAEDAASNRKKAPGGNGKRLATLPKKPADFVKLGKSRTIDDVAEQVSNDFPFRSVNLQTASDKNTQCLTLEKTADRENQNNGLMIQKGPSSEAPKTIVLEAFHIELLSTLNKIDNTSNEIEKRLKAIEDSLKAKVLTLPEIQNNGNIADADALENMLPLGTLVAFDEFEMKLRGKEFASQVIHFMRTLGGKDLHDFLFNALKRCLSNSVANEYSMEGKKQKKKLRPTYFLRTILKAAKMHRPDSDEETAVKIISNWLAGAKLRLTREKDKLLGANRPEQVPDMDLEL